MSALVWDGWTTPEGDVETAAGQPVAANWHYLRTRLRHDRRLVIVAVVLGVLAAAGSLVAVPAGHRATTLLVLAHDPQVDPSRAMETDLSLATTRAVAQRTIDELTLATTPEELLRRVRVTASSADTAQLSLTSTSDAEAVRELSAYTAAFLVIRSDQVRATAEALASGSQQRIEELQSRADALTRQINTVPGTGAAGSALLGDLVGQRSQLIAQIGTLEQTGEDARLRADSVVEASSVVDPARADPSAMLRQVVLVLATGLVGGAGLGVALVLGRALTSTRLHRREEVASALGAAVAVSVGPIDAGPWWSRGLQRLVGRRRAAEGRSDIERRRLARAVERHFPAQGWRQRLVVGCIDNAADLAPVLVDVALSARERGGAVHLVDLTEHGVLLAAAAAVDGSGPDAADDEAESSPRQALDVIRPADVPSLSQGPRDLAEAADSDIAQLTFPSAGHEVLVLADLHPAVGADHLASWAERAIVAVTSGRSEAERVLACGRMLRAAGVDVVAAVLLDADPADESSGQPSPTLGSPVAGAS